MKRMILAAAVAALISTAQASIPGDVMSVTTKDGVATVVMNGDTVVNTNVGQLAERLNDTLASTSGGVYTFNYGGGSSEGGVFPRYHNDFYRLLDENDGVALLTGIIIVAVISFTILACVIASLVYFYRNRRNRLRVIEKAVENGYQLPDSFYTGRTEPERQVVVNSTVPGEEPIQVTSDNTAGQGGPIFQYLTEREIRNGVTLAIVGFGIIIFFALAGAQVVAALGVIPLLMGVAKIAIPYLRRRSISMPPPQQPGNQQPTTPPQFTQPE